MPAASPTMPIVKWTALCAPLPWPPGILTRPEIDQEQMGSCPTDFASDLAALEALLEAAVSDANEVRPPRASDLRPDVTGGVAALGVLHTRIITCASSAPDSPRLYRAAGWQSSRVGLLGASSQ